jgi:BASS family bile acid:Na+ symporter
VLSMNVLMIVAGSVATSTALIIAAVAAIGLAIGHWLGGPNPDDRTVLALSTASRHPAIALAAATAGAGPNRSASSPQYCCT